MPGSKKCFRANDGATFPPSPLHILSLSAHCSVRATIVGSEARMKRKLLLFFAAMIIGQPATSQLVSHASWEVKPDECDNIYGSCRTPPPPAYLGKD